MKSTSSHCKITILCNSSCFSVAGDKRWTVVTSDISNAEENREKLLFCDFHPSKWYQLRISAINDAGKTTEHYNFATSNIDGSIMSSPPAFATDTDVIHNLINVTNADNEWLAAIIITVIITVIIILM